MAVGRSYELSVSFRVEDYDSTRITYKQDIIDFEHLNCKIEQIFKKKASLFSLNYSKALGMTVASEK